MERTRATKWLPIVGLEKLGRPLRWYHRLTWRVCKVARWILRIQTHGMEAIPKTGGAVVIAPHFSYSDSFPCLYTALPRPPRFLASAFFATAHPVASWLAFLGGVIPARRDHPDPGAVRRVLRLLANGELVVLFPEGGRTWAGSPTAPMRSAAKLLGRLRVPLYVASIEGAYDHWPRWDARPRLRKMRVRLAFQLALPALDDRSRSRRSPRSWWQSVYVSGGSLDVEATRASIHSALSHAAAGERQAIDLSRVKRLAALPRLICFCPECGLPRTAIHNRQLICRACGAAWIPDRDGRLRRIGHGETLAAVFMRMAERLERRASEAFALEEPIAVRGVHPSSAVGTGAFVAGTARVSSGGLDVVTAGERWRIPLHLAANADIEGGRIVALRAPGGEPLHLRLENGALRLVLAARALLGLPISGLAP